MHVKKILLFAICLVTLVAASGCRLNIIRLNKRIDRWESMKQKASAQDKFDFAVETLFFFLTTEDFQRSKEAVVTEAERLRYHQVLSDMQIYLMGYYADRALSSISGGKEDWDQGQAEWAKADSLALGHIPGHQTTYLMVFIQSGYLQYLKEISYQGFLYDRYEQKYPGLMEALRKMSGFQYRLAEHLDSLGFKELAYERYLFVFKRDPDNFPKADKRVRQLTGRTIREIYDIQFKNDVAMKTYNAFREEMYGMALDWLRGGKEATGKDENELFPELAAHIARYYQMPIEQTTDTYFYTKYLTEGTLPAYLNLSRYRILKGYKPLIYMFLKQA